MIRFAESAPEATANPTPDPTLRKPDTDQLADEIAELAAQIHAATYRLLVLIAEFDRRQDFGWGFKSCAHWLSWRTSIGIGTAREHVRVARALPDLPLISEGMKSGELSFSKVRALTRVATAANESDLLIFARHGTASQVERLVRAWRRVDRNEEAALERTRHESRSLTVYPDEDGSWIVRGRLDPEVGALLRKALEAAGDELYRESRETAESGESGDEGSAPVSPVIIEDRPSHGQRMADAIGLVAERALASEGRVRRADRFQVVLHVDEPALANPEDTEQAADAEHRPDTAHQPDTGHSVLEESGYRVPAGTSRRLSCDASLVPMTHDAEGEVLNVGRRTRTVPPAIRRALEYRDRTCRFPGCGVRHADAHHIVHWADGGETSLENLLLLCRRHHRVVHEGEVTMEVPDGSDDDASEPRFLRPDGRPIVPAPAAPPLGPDPLSDLVVTHREAGIEPDAWTPTPLWNGEPFDLGFAVSAFRGWRSPTRSRGNVS